MEKAYDQARPAAGDVLAAAEHCLRSPSENATSDGGARASAVHVLSHRSRVRLFAAPWTVAPQAPLSMGFSRQEYWSGLPCPPPGNLPHSGILRTSLTSPALAGGFFTTRATWEAPAQVKTCEVEQDLKFSESTDRQERKQSCGSTGVITAGARCWALQLFSRSVVSNSLRPQGLQHARPPCPSPTPRSLPKFVSIASVMPFLLQG